MCGGGSIGAIKILAYSVSNETMFAYVSSKALQRPVINLLDFHSSTSDAFSVFVNCDYNHLKDVNTQLSLPYVDVVSLGYLSWVVVCDHHPIHKLYWCELASNIYYANEFLL